MKNVMCTFFLRMFIIVVALNMPLRAFCAADGTNNIYLFDCTHSMVDQGLWQAAKLALDTTVVSQSQLPGSKFSVVMFGDEPYETFSFSGQGYAGRKKSIDDAQEKYLKLARNTNICDALRQGFSLTEPAMKNKIYLLTDGIPNKGGGPEDVARLIREWCPSHRNTLLFYVALADGALNPVIKAAVDECGDAFIVDVSDGVIGQIADISSEIHANVEELDRTYSVRFSIPGKYAVEAVCDDPVFKVEVPGGFASGCSVPLKISSRDGLSVAELHQTLALFEDDLYCFPVEIRSVSPSVRIANPEVMVFMTDYIQGRLEVFGGSGNAFFTDGCTWYDSFLWCEESLPGQVTLDLEPAFENVAPGAGRMLMAVEPLSGQPRDFKVFFNGNEIPAGRAFAVEQDKEAVLTVMFDRDALEGERNFTIRCQAEGQVEIVNGVAAPDFTEISLRSSYKVVMNPLLKALLIALAVLVVLMLLWLLLLRRTFFPGIKANRIELTGPGTYYVSKRIKGARKVVLTRMRKKGNALSNIFLGKVIYVRADHFMPALEIRPATGKKIRVQNIGKGMDAWDITPSSTLAPYENAVIMRRGGSEKMGISVG